MAQFDYVGAINEGYSNEEISKYTGVEFDYAGAVKEEYENDEIESYIKNLYVEDKTMTQEELLVQDDKVLSKKQELLDSQINSMISQIDESTDFDDKQKKIAKEKLELKKLEKQEEYQKEAYSKYVEQNKQAPIPSDYKDNKLKDKDLVSEFANAVKEPFSPAIDLALNYAGKTAGSVLAVSEQVGNVVFQNNSEFFENKLTELKEEGIRLNKTIDPNNKLKLKPTTMTEIFAGVAVPFNITNKAKMTMVESFLGFTNEYSDSQDLAKSLDSAYLQGGTALVSTELANKFIGMFSKQGTNKTLDYLWDKHSLELTQSSGLGSNASKEEVISVIENRWLEVMQSSGSNEDKIRAMIDSLGETGAGYKLAIQEVADTAKEVNVRAPKQSRVEDVALEVGKVANIEEGAEALGKEVGLDAKAARYRAEDIVDNFRPENVSDELKRRATNIFTKRLTQGDIGKLYGETIDALKSKYKNTFDLGDDISSVKASLQGSIAKGGNLTPTERNLADALDEPMTISNMLRIKREITPLLKTAKGTQLQNIKKLKSNIEFKLSKNLDKKDYSLIKKLDDEYTNRSSVRGKKDLNKFGVELLKIANDKSNLNKVLETLDTMSVSNIDIREIEKIVGTKNIAKIEAGIVKSMLNKNVDEVSWDVISKSLNKMGFVSKEGKEAKKIIDKMNSAFSADNFTNILKVRGKLSEDGAGALTADMIAKIKYAASSGIFKEFKKRFFLTKTYEEIRILENLADVLSNKKVNVRGMSIKPEEVSKVVRSSIKSTYKQQIEQMKLDTPVTDEEIDELVDASMSNLGMSSSYGGKATRGTSVGTSAYDDYADSLFNKPKDKEEFVREINRMGITDNASSIKAKNDYESGSREWFASLTNKQKEEVVEIVEAKRDVTGGYQLTDLYEEGLTKYNKSNNAEPSYKDITESLIPTKQVTKDTSGNLGMTKDYGGKATSGGGVNDLMSQEKLDNFMRDIANPSSTINKEYVSNLADSLDVDLKMAYGMTDAKKKSLEKLRGLVEALKRMDKINESQKRQIKEALEEYINSK